MKILITGNAGSGKSTLAQKISDLLALPLHGLDSVVWKENWAKTESQERKQKIERLINEPDWVIDGVSTQVMQSADFIVFIDRPAIQCFYRAMKRNIPYLFTPRPGLPAGCYEYRIIPCLVRMIFQFNAVVKPSIMECLIDQPHIVLKTDREVIHFIEKVSAAESCSLEHTLR